MNFMPDCLRAVRLFFRLIKKGEKLMINEEKHYDLIKFADGDFSLDVKVSPDEDTVWLSANQIAILFDRDYKTILKHINNILKKELNKSVVANFATTANDGKNII